MQVSAGLVAVWALLALVVLWCAFAARFALRARRLWRGVGDTPGARPRADLPEAVAAFALRGLAGDAPARALTLRQEADFRLKHRGPLSALPSRQIIAAARPGFVWVAVKRIAALPAFAVVDSYVNGAGWLGARLLAAVPVANLAGAGADRAEAMRYLAELPWCPDAILTNPALSWRIDGDSAVTVSLNTPGGPAEVAFGLDENSDFATVTARDRPAEIGPDGNPVLRDWQGAFSDYAMIGPRRIPRAGEIGYLYEDGYEAYWIGRVTALAAIR